MNETKDLLELMLVNMKEISIIRALNWLKSRENWLIKIISKVKVNKNAILQY